MNIKLFIGSAMAVALVGAGVLAGSVAGASSAAAQTQSATPAATAQTTPSAQSTPGTTTPPAGMHEGRGGGRGFGHGDFGIGPGGRGATSENATQQITNTTQVLDLVKSDLAYANGKMDTADVQRWVNGADTLLKSAQSANSSSQFGQAVAYAQAARELAMTARSQMAQELGADQLPSNGQLPQRGDKGVSTDATVTQAQASRMLASAYNRLVAEAAVIQGASNAAQAAPYLTDAQNAYKDAYSAYQAGNYSDAAAAARLAEKLAHVAEAIAEASAAPANADTPVTVPAPNF